MFFRGKVFWLSLAIATLMIVTASFAWKDGGYREANSYIFMALGVLVIGLLFRPVVEFFLGPKEEEVNGPGPVTLATFRDGGETGSPGL